jgi:hypothetical protein
VARAAIWQVGGEVRVGSATGLVAYRATKASGVFDVRWVGDGVAQPPVYVGSNNGNLWDSIHLDWRRRVIADELAAAPVGDAAPMADTPATDITDTAADAVTDAPADIPVDAPADAAASFARDEVHDDAIAAVESV